VKEKYNSVFEKITPKVVLESIGKLTLYGAIGTFIGVYVVTDSNKIKLGLYIQEQQLDQKSEPYKIENTGKTVLESNKNTVDQKTFIDENLKHLNSSDNFVPVVLYKNGSPFCSGTEFTSKKNLEKYTLGIEHCFESNNFHERITEFRISNISLNDSAVIIPDKLLRSEGIYTNPAQEHLIRRGINISAELRNFRTSELKTCTQFTSKPSLTSINMNYAKSTASEYQLFWGGSSGAGLFAKNKNGENCFYGVLKGFTIPNSRKILEELKKGSFKDDTVKVNYNFVTPGESKNSEWVSKQTAGTARPLDSTFNSKEYK
jgi:hypothetical protein